MHLNYWSENPSPLYIPHFVGASPNSTNLRQTLKRFCTILNKANDSSEEVPEDIKELLKVFPEWIEKAANNKKIIFIIDAVNQFEKTDNAHDMRWIPQGLPDKVKFIVSTLSGDAFDSLASRRTKPTVEQLTGLSEAEIREFVSEYLKEIRHEFPNEEVERAFFNKVKHGNPLYIQVALEELRVFGKFEELAERIDNLPDNVLTLFDQVLERIESDFNPQLVRDCMSYIACGKHGMTAEELQALLKEHASHIDFDITPEKLPDMLWARLYRAFSTYLFERSGVIDFFHSQLKEAVGKRYLQKEADRKSTHKTIADYFETRWKEPYNRALEELPHQRTKEEWDGLELILTDLHFIEAKCAAGMTYDIVADYSNTMNMENKLRPELYRIGEFSSFFKMQSHILKNYPELTFQQAINMPGQSEAFKTAFQLLDSGLIDRPWFQLKNKPQHKPSCIMTLLAHSKDVTCCTVFLGGKRTLSVYRDKTLKIWDTDTGEELNIFKGYSNCVVFPDGRRILLCSSSSHKIWDSDTEEEPRDFKGYGTNGVFFTDSKRILSAIGNSLLIWDVETGKEVTIFRGHSINSLLYVSETVSCTLGHSDRITAYAVFPDGKRILTGSNDKTLKIWDAETGEVLRSLRFYDGITCCAILHEGKSIAAGYGKILRIFDAKTGVMLKQLNGHTGKVTSSAVFPDGKHIISGSEDSTLKIWDTETGKELFTLHGHSDPVLFCAMFPDGKRVVSASMDKTLKIWNIENLKTEDSSSCNSGEIISYDITTCAIDPNGKRIVSTSRDKTLKIWDTKTGQKITTLIGHSDTVASCGISPDGTHIASASLDYTLKIWNMKSGELLTTLHHGREYISSFVFFPDGNNILSASNFWGGSNHHRGNLQIWNIETGRLIKTINIFSHGNDSVFFCAVLPDGRGILSASTDKEVRIWDVVTGKELDKDYNYYSYALSPYFIPTVSNKCLPYWEYSDEVTSSTFSPDGRYIVSTSLDKTLKIWDMETGKALATFYADVNLELSLTAPLNLFVATSMIGHVFILSLKNVLSNPPIVTSVYLYRLMRKDWDKEASVICKWCGKCFTVTDKILDVITAINCNTGFTPDKSPCLELPDEAWDEPRLLSECPHCQKPLKFNPFVVDNRDRY